MELTFDPDARVTLALDGTPVYSLHTNPLIRARLIIVAWGDDHEFEVEFNDIALTIPEL